MGLHVCVLGTEKLLGAIDGQLFGAIDEFAPAVISFSRVTLGVFVREHRAHGLEHRFGNQIFRGDQLEPGRLAARFELDDFGNFRIDLAQRAIHALGLGETARTLTRSAHALGVLMGLGALIRCTCAPDRVPSFWRCGAGGGHPRILRRGNFPQSR